MRLSQELALGSRRLGRIFEVHYADAYPVRHEELRARTIQGYFVLVLYSVEIIPTDHRRRRLTATRAPRTSVLQSRVRERGRIDV